MVVFSFAFRVVWLVLERIDLSAGRNQRFSQEIAINYISVVYL